MRVVTPYPCESSFDRTCGDLADGDAELKGFSLDHYKACINHEVVFHP